MSGSYQWTLTELENLAEPQNPDVTVCHTAQM